jgi:hypothetical protein
MHAIAHKAICAFLRLCLSALAGACWGLFLGFALAMLGLWLETSVTFDVALHRFVERYAAGALILGGVAGAVDFMICATWPKTAGLLIHSLLWVLIPGNIIGLLFFSTSLIQGNANRDSKILVALAFACCMGATFGFVMAIVHRIGLRLFAERANQVCPPSPIERRC